MRVLIAFPIMTLLIILQTVVVRQIPLLQGSADLVLLAVISWALQKRVDTVWHWGVIAGLLVSLVSAIPVYLVILNYLVAAAIALLMRRRIWRISFFVMLVTTFISTIVTQAITLLSLRILGTPLPLMESINLIILPSILLNLLLALPFYFWMGDLASWLYPELLEA